MFLVELFYGILMIVLGAWLIKYRKTVKSWTGNFVWAERYIWSGWTYVVLMALWLFFIFVGVWYPFGWAEQLSEWSKDAIMERGQINGD